MWFRIVLILLAFYTLSFSAPKKDLKQLDPKLGFVTEHIISNGLDRTYHVKLPSNTHHKPLLFLLHDAEKNLKTMMEAYGESLMKHALINEFIVVIPEAWKEIWNDGRKLKSQSHKGKELQDVRFFRDMIKKLDNQYSIDKQNIFFAGSSDGGMMNYRLLCEMPEFINAIASINASLPLDLASCKNKKEKSFGILIMNGTDDRWIPWEGGTVMPFAQKPYGEVYSAPYTRDFFLKFNNQSRDESAHYALEDLIQIDDSHVSVEEYGVSLHFYTIHGGGHTVPDRYTEQFHYKSRIRYERYGATNMDFSATDKIFDFFWRHLKY